MSGSRTASPPSCVGITDARLTGLSLPKYFEVLSNPVAGSKNKSNICFDRVMVLIINDFFIIYCCFKRFNNCIFINFRPACSTHCSNIGNCSKRNIRFYIYVVLIFIISCKNITGVISLYKCTGCSTVGNTVYNT